MPAVPAGAAVGADASITASAAPNPVEVGELLTYSITVANEGVGATEDTTVVDALATAVDLESVSTTVGSCSGSTTLVCNLGTPSPGATAGRSHRDRSRSPLTARSRARSIRAFDCAFHGPREGPVYNDPRSPGGLVVAERLTCDLQHDRSVPATVKLEIKSTRAGRPGHPMIRVTALCAAHARELRRFGLELVGT